MTALLDLAANWFPARWSSNRKVRHASAAVLPSGHACLDATYTTVVDPPWWVIVSGGDPIALAIAALAESSGFEVVVVRPRDPETPVPLPGITYQPGSARAALQRWRPDKWTAVISATHDDDLDDEAITIALDLPTAFVGVLGSPQRVPARRQHLEVAGCSPLRVADLHAPIGALRCGEAPWEVAVSVIAEVMQVRALRLTKDDKPWSSLRKER